jgi:hypothetical protein
MNVVIIHLMSGRRVRCPRCWGTGTISVPWKRNGQWVFETRPCPDCYPKARKCQ